MAADYTLVNLDDVDDLAVAYGTGHIQEARFARDALGCVATGVAMHRIKPGMRQAFGHRHEAAEEVVVVLDGSGRANLDGVIVELGRLDALRLAPAVARRFEAGDDGMTLLVFGPHHAGDGELLPDHWAD